MKIAERLTSIATLMILGLVTGCVVTSVNGLKGDITMVGEGGTTVTQEGTSTIKVTSEPPDGSELTTRTLVIHSIAFAPENLVFNDWGREAWKNEWYALYHGYPNAPRLFAQVPPGSIPNNATVTRFSCLLADSDDSARIVVELYRVRVSTQVDWERLATVSTSIDESSGDWHIAESESLNIIYHEDSSYIVSWGRGWSGTYDCSQCFLSSCSISYEPPD
jgi:hypothetical protein